MSTGIEFSHSIEGVDWALLKEALAKDDFDNGRTPEQLRQSFENSQFICFAHAQHRVVGSGRVLSDGVGNAYLLDLWTHSAYRRRGIASQILELLLSQLSGQHVYLQADEHLVQFYQKRGFAPQPHGLFRIEGQYLHNSARPGSQR